MQGARQPSGSKPRGTHKHAAGSLLDKSAVTASSHSNTVLRNETHSVLTTSTTSWKARGALQPRWPACRRSDMTDAMDPVRILASLSDPSRRRPNGRVWSMERVGELGVLCMLSSTASSGPPGWRAWLRSQAARALKLHRWCVEN
jgi:hypothetical protein